MRHGGEDGGHTGIPPTPNTPVAPQIPSVLSPIPAVGLGTPPPHVSPRVPSHLWGWGPSYVGLGTPCVTSVGLGTPNSTSHLICGAGDPRLNVLSHLQTPVAVVRGPCGHICGVGDPQLNIPSHVWGWGPPSVGLGTPMSRLWG